MKGTTTNSTISDAIKMRMSWTDKHPHTNNGNKKKIQLSEMKWENTAFAYSPLVILQEIDNFKLVRVIFLRCDYFFFAANLALRLASSS